mmetsp:Transcript_42110/g.82584  ORF Transcript_42110/g.82584 Transcript_42110/m.82584 type:complete len:372 (-) Transcript_42110:11-1126(-)
MESSNLISFGTVDFLQTFDTILSANSYDEPRNQSLKGASSPTTISHNVYHATLNEIPAIECKRLNKELDLPDGDMSISSKVSQIFERSMSSLVSEPHSSSTLCSNFSSHGGVEIEGEEEESLFYKTFGRPSIRSLRPTPILPALTETSHFGAFPCERILSSSNIQEMYDAGALPEHLVGMKWKTIFSTERDGTSFHTFMKNVVGCSSTIIVGQSTTREILGGFVDSPWVKKKKKCNGFEAHESGFYGNGQAFLFEIVNRKYLHSKLDETGRPCCDSNSITACKSNSASVNIFPWTGANPFIQLCDPQLCRIAMGGGDGEFGLCFDDSFQIGSSGACDTFGNWRPLVASEDTNGSFFELINVEVYGTFNYDS